MLGHSLKAWWLAVSVPAAIAYVASWLVAVGAIIFLAGVIVAAHRVGHDVLTRIKG